MRRYDEFERWLVKTVEETGCAVLSVSPRKDSDDPEEWFSYSIGLPKTLQWPELICFGLSNESRKFIINDAVAECRKKQLHPRPGLRLSEVLNGFDIVLADADYIPDSYFGSANWFAGDCGLERPVKRLQLLWPDAAGYYPGEEQCDGEVIAAQTPLEAR